MAGYHERGTQSLVSVAKLGNSLQVQVQDPKTSATSFT